MKSNIENLYNKFDIAELINKKKLNISSSNPFYEVYNFLAMQSKKNNTVIPLYNNFNKNLKDLTIIDNYNMQNLGMYDYEKNAIYSKNKKSDIYLLLHLASNDREKPYTGIINNNDTGYALNNGLTDLFANMISNKKVSYPVETMIAKCIYNIDKKVTLESYFGNNSSKFNSISKRIINLEELLDKYHNNYIDIVELNKEVFLKERIYFLPLYGKYFKRKDEVLSYLEEDLINKKSQNYIVLSNVIDEISNLVAESNIVIADKCKILYNLNNEMHQLFTKNENFYYLEGLADKKINNYIAKKLIK